MVAIKLDLVLVTLTTGLTFQLFIYERKQWHANYRLPTKVHCHKEIRPGNECDKDRYVDRYVRTMPLSSETDEKELQNS